MAIGSGIGLLVLAAFLPTLKAEGVKQSDTFLTTVESVTGADALARHFPAGSGTPTIVIGPADKAQAIVSTIQATAAWSSVVPVTDAPAGRSGQPAPPPKVVDGRVQFQVDAEGPVGLDGRRGHGAAAADRPGRRERRHPGRRRTAQNLDIRDISTADRNRVIPITSR